MNTNQTSPRTAPPSRKRLIAATVLCVFFFPVGIVVLALALKRYANDSVRDDRTVLHCGLAMAIWFVLDLYHYLISLGMAVDQAQLAAAGTFQDWAHPFLRSGYAILLFESVPALITAVVLLVSYRSLSLRNRKLRRCLMLVQQEHITSLPLIADISGLTLDKTGALFEKLFALGFLEGAYLSADRRELLFTRSVWAKQRLICAHCGAELVADLGRTLICEYCGNPLTIQRVHHTPPIRQ